MTSEQRPPTPQQRARAEAITEIRRIARGQLAGGGAGALSLREIAREMGLVSSAVYRYVPSRDALLTALIQEAYDALGQTAEAADAALPREDLAARWRALAHSLRAWARARPTDYTLVFGPPVAGYEAPPETFAPAQRWIEIMIDILARAARRVDAPAPPTDERLRARLETLRDRRSPGAPLGMIASGLRAWAQIHGLVALEIHGQIAFVIGEAGEFFDDGIEHQIRELGLPGDVCG